MATNLTSVATMQVHHSAVNNASPTAAGATTAAPASVKKHEYHVEHIENNTRVVDARSPRTTPESASTGPPQVLDELLKIISNLPLHNLAYFLALIYISACVSMATGLTPLWMVLIIAVVSTGLFVKLGL